MKHHSILLVCLCLATTLHAQTYVNPFEANKNEFNNQDILVLWNEPTTGQVVQKLYGFDWIADMGSQSDVVIPLLPEEDLAGFQVTQFMDCATGRFNDDALADVFYLVEQPTAWRCALTNLETTFEQADSSFTYAMLPPTTPVEIPKAAASGYPRTTIGDLDGDGTDEVAVAWWESADNTIHIQVLDADNGLQLQVRGAIADQLSYRINGQHDAYDIASADLNGDGADELILIGIENSGSGDATYQVFVKTYEVNVAGSATITPMASLVLDDTHLVDTVIDNDFLLLGYAQTAVTPMRTHADTLADATEDVMASFAFRYYGGELPMYPNFFQYLVRSTPDLGTLTIVDTHALELSSSEFMEEYPLDRATGDLNGDRIDDAVLAPGAVHVFTVINDVIEHHGAQSQLQLNEDYSGILETVDRLDVGDVDHDGREEIITFSKSYNGDGDHTFTIQVRGMDEAFNFDPVGSGSQLFVQEHDDAVRSYAVAIGNLDGNDLHFGDPIVQDCQYTQPVFITGAIPTHFDVIDGVQYDVNGCYPVQDCDLSVRITQSQSTSTEATASFTGDWAVSSTVDVDVNIKEVVTLGTTISAKYGHKFEHVNTTTESQTLTISVNATADDMVQYLQMPLTTYHYPVLNDGGDTVSWVLAAFPVDNFSPQTIIANGKSLFNFTPEYEVGNLLSYPPISNSYASALGFPTVPGNWIILPPGDLPDYTMSPSGGVVYTLTSSSGLSWSDSYTNYGSIDMGVSPGGFGVGLPTPEDFGYPGAAELPGFAEPNMLEVSQLSIYSTEISQETEFEITTANVIGSPNEFNYVIRPKIFWNTDGAGTVNFDLDMNASSGSGSFWSQAYTNAPDPALNLPYRYEQVINPDITNTANLQRTKSMRFSTLLPQIGDSFSIFLRVYNYSFLPTTGPVPFRLYVGDPAQGGIPIANTVGATLFHTSAALGARGREEVEVSVIATTDMVTSGFIRIFAVLDPDADIAEIHEENNIGWAQFGYSCNQPDVLVGMQEFDTMEPTDRLRIFPVPANDQVVIEHDLRGLRSDRGEVIIHDALGAMVARFPVTPFHEGRIFWNARNVDPGLYMISLYNAHSRVHTGRAIITR